MVFRDEKAAISASADHGPCASSPFGGIHSCDSSLWTSSSVAPSVIQNHTRLQNLAGGSSNGFGSPRAAAHPSKFLQYVRA